MPNRGVLLMLFVAVTFVVIANPFAASPPTGPVGSAWPGSDASVRAEPAELRPITEFGDEGWIRRTIVAESDSPATGRVEVVVELRFVWSAGSGQLVISGHDTDGRYHDVVRDETRSGPELAASLEQYQRMYDELRDGGGAVELDGQVTVARQTFLTPDGSAEDTWRLGVGTPDW